MLTDTGEVLFPLYESGSVLYVCLVNVSTDAGFGLNIPESSDDGMHYIVGKDLSITVPPELACVSSEADSSDSFYHMGYFDYVSLHKYLVENNIYLFGTTEDRLYELTLQFFDYSDYDFNMANDELLSKYTKQIKRTLGFSAKDIKDDIYQGKTNKAIRIQYKLGTLFSGDQYILLYYMTHGSDLLKMQFLSYSKEITSDQEDMVREIFDSIEWGAKQAEQERYYDKEIGISFILPPGWHKEKESVGGASMSTKLQIGSYHTWVSYECDDLWVKYYKDNREIADMFGLKRSNYFLLENPDTIVEKLLDCDEYMISNKRIADKKYYHINEWMRSTDQDVVYYYFDNGYMYKFLLSGENVGNYIDQLESFLMTVEYEEKSGESSDWEW